MIKATDEMVEIDPKKLAERLHDSLTVLGANVKVEGSLWLDHCGVVLEAIDALSVPVPAQEAEGNAAAQIERLAVLRNLGGNHGGEGEDAPDQSSVDAAIAFIRRWGLPDKAITTLSDRGYAAIELHGENYADITFVPAHSGEREALERRIRSAGLKARDEVVDGIRGDGSPDNDLADYLERIVDACVCAALEGKQP